MHKRYVSKWFLVVAAIGFLLTAGSSVVRAQLNVSPPATLTLTPGEMISIPINLTNPAAQAIDAFGMSVLFPGSILEFDTVQTAGTLTAGWIAVNANLANPSELTVGGFNTTGITASGVLLNLNFRVKCGVTGEESLRLRNFLDDFSGATTTDGVIQIAPPAVFTAILTGDQEVAPVSTPARGEITATLSCDQLVVTGSFSNLSSDFNAAIRGCYRARGHSESR